MTKILTLFEKYQITESTSTHWNKEQRIFSSFFFNLDDKISLFNVNILL